MASTELLSKLVESGDRSIIIVDETGVPRFAPDLTTEAALFDHHSYVGRSGSMYAYGGIGSVYWHMVTKLLLATQAATIDAK